MLSVCGVNCGECPHMGTECDGCDKIKGKVYWTQYVGAETCPIYQCVADKKFQHCGDCSKMPCDTWFSLKDPSWSEEQHRKSVESRKKVLTSLQDK